MLITIPQAAARRKTTKYSVYRWIKNGLKSKRFGRDWLIDQKDLDAYRPRGVGRPNRAKPSRLSRAQEASKVAPSWADLANTIFDPNSGLLAKVFPTVEMRRAFIATPEYQEFKKLIEAAQDRTGFIKGATPTKSGKLLVRLPRSMHEALEVESMNESADPELAQVVNAWPRLSEADRRAILAIVKGEAEPR